MSVLVTAMMDHALSEQDLQKLPTRLCANEALSEASARLSAEYYGQQLPRHNPLRWEAEPNPDFPGLLAEWRAKHTAEYHDPQSRSSLRIYAQGLEFTPNVKFGAFLIYRNVRNAVADMAAAIARTVSARSVIYMPNAGQAEFALDLLGLGGSLNDARKELVRRGFEAAAVSADITDATEDVYLVERIRPQPRRVSR